MKLTHEKFASFVFAGAIALVMIMGMALQVYVAPAYWMSILIRRLVSIVVVAAGWWVCYRIKPVLRLILLLKDVKMLALLLPMVLLAVGWYWYHSVLFPAGAVFVLFSMIYAFRDDHVEFALLGIATFAVYFAVESLGNCNPANAITILAGGVMAIVTAYDVKWFYVASFRMKTKQVIALFLLAATAVFFGVIPELGQIVGDTLANGGQGPITPSLLEMTCLCFGKADFWILIVSLSVILVYGWILVLLNRGLKHHYAVAAMTIMTAWILGDVLKIVGFPTIGLGTGNALEMCLWLTCAIAILPPEYLFPDDWQYHYDPTDFDFEGYEVPEDFDFEDLDDCEEAPDDTDGNEEKATDYMDFWDRVNSMFDFAVLYTTLTNPERDLAPDEELEMWEKVYFKYNERISDRYEDKLFTQFQNFCQKTEVFKK